MSTRFITATLVGACMIGGLATIVTPNTVSSAPEVASAHVANTVVEKTAHTVVEKTAHNVIAVKNRVWPPASMITVEPCAVAQCSDA